MQVNAINFEKVNTNYNKVANVAPNKQEEVARPQMKEAYSSDASMAIKNAMVAGIQINKPEAPEVKEVRVSDGSLSKAKGEMVEDFRHYEKGSFMNSDATIVRSEESYEKYLDTNVKAGELVILGDDGLKMATGMNGVTNRFQAEAKQDPEHITVSDCVVKSGVRFNEVEEKYGDYAIMDENGLVNFYDKDDNNIGSMQAEVKKQ